MIEDKLVHRCSRCSAPLSRLHNEDRDLCKACVSEFGSADALQETLVYWEGTGGLRSLLRHVIFLGVIGIIAIIAYFVGS